MSEIVLLHSVLGVRDGVLEGAERLRAAGHVVHVPDLYGGTVFDDYAEATRFVDSFGSYPELMRRSAEAVDGLRSDLLYAGFSNGGGCSTFLAATRPGARGLLSMHAATPLGVLGLATPWPASVPVQVHYGKDDPFRPQEWVDAFAADVRGSGAGYEFVEYPVKGHLFTDRSLPAEYDEASAEQLWTRALEFVERVGG
jgi:dienelactone hydrolase